MGAGPSAAGTNGWAVRARRGAGLKAAAGGGAERGGGDRGQRVRGAGVPWWGRGCYLGVPGRLCPTGGSSGAPRVCVGVPAAEPAPPGAAPLQPIALQASPPPSE